jgi:hypothetical protein
MVTNVIDDCKEIDDSKEKEESLNDFLNRVVKSEQHFVQDWTHVNEVGQED